MAELARLKAEQEKAGVTLVLTDTHLTLEPSPEFINKLRDGFQQGREGGARAGGVIGWIVEKAIGFAENYVDKVFESHPLDEVELFLASDRLEVKLGRVHFNVGAFEVDPADAYIFDAKFRDAREALRDR